MPDMKTFQPIFLLTDKASIKLYKCFLDAYRLSGHRLGQFYWTKHAEEIKFYVMEALAESFSVPCIPDAVDWSNLLDQMDVKLLTALCVTLLDTKLEGIDTPDLIGGWLEKPEKPAEDEVTDKGTIRKMILVSSIVLPKETEEHEKALAKKLDISSAKRLFRKLRKKGDEEFAAAKN